MEAALVLVDANSLENLKMPRRPAISGPTGGGRPGTFPGRPNGPHPRLQELNAVDLDLEDLKA